ncbi:MAG: hypothetical protein MUC49_14835 [Raineya sp.]|jgi:hypothetical protein|nr:hypothetical protein [Raineya sp.]
MKTETIKTLLEVYGLSFEDFDENVKPNFNDNYHSDKVYNYIIEELFCEVRAFRRKRDIVSFVELAKETLSDESLANDTIFLESLDDYLKLLQDFPKTQETKVLLALSIQRNQILNDLTVETATQLSKIRKVLEGIENKL